jgi:hypothetical protein
MAKIGNEAKLILKLAEERFQAAMKKHGDEAALADGQDNKLSTSRRNKAAGLEEGLAILKSIYLELQAD